VRDIGGFATECAINGYLGTAVYKHRCGADPATGRSFGTMAAFGQQCSHHDEPIDRWHPRVRALIILSGSIAGWSAMGMLIFRP
jgi:hypothetical protein